MIFAQQVYVYGRPGDILIGLSTSGNSGNVVRGVDGGAGLRVDDDWFHRKPSARMDALCDIRLKVPAEETHKIQEFHLPVYHTLCLMVEQELIRKDEG